MNAGKFAAVFLAALAAPLSAHAFPELVRHGYNTCITCHVSPSGGGVLTEYGRALSREVLSSRGKDGEERFLYGLIRPPAALALGGDFRTLQTYRDTSRVREGRFFFMQSDLEAALTVGRFTADGTIGWDEPDEAFISHRHWLMARASDEILFRAGKYFFNYGLMIADHNTSIRKGLGWDQGTETYNLEGAWISENWEIHLTGILGRPDKTLLNREQGGALTIAKPLGESYKVGLSGFVGTSAAGDRVVTGPFAMLGFTPKFFLLSEVDLKFAFASTTGAAMYNRLDYELWQGFHVYLTQEYNRLNFKSSKSLVDAYGGGIQFFPRPHWELNLQYQQQRIVASSRDFIDFAYLLVHFYP